MITRRLPSPARPRFILLILLSLLLAGCGTVLPTQEPIRLTVAVSSSAAPLARDLAEALHHDTPFVTMDVLTLANEAAAQQAALSGQADAALVAGELPPAAGLTAQPIAADALVVVVHPQRDLAAISVAQMQDVLRGQLRAWADLGAGEGDIQVLAREAGSGARGVMTAVFLDPRPLTPTALLMPDDARLRDMAAADPNAITVLPAAWLNDTVRAVPLEGRGPEWVRNGWPDYPAILPIFLVLPAEPSPALTQLTRFIAGEAGRQAISRHYALAEVQP